MEWQKEYQRKLRSPRDAVLENIQSGDKVFIGGVTVATTSLNALFSAVDEEKLNGLRLYCMCTCNEGLELGKYRFREDQMVIETHFMTGTERNYMFDHKMIYSPIQFSAYETCMKKIHPNVCLVPMTPPDEEGYCNIGPYGFSNVSLAGAERIIAQISTTIPEVNGTCHRIHVSKIDAFVEAEEKLAIVGRTDPTEAEGKIADNIMNYLKDGDCIQLGYGGIANAIGYKLRSLKHLGIHSETLTDSIVELMECGAVDNSRKKYFPGQTAIGFVFGTMKQYNYIHKNKDFIFGTFDEIVNVEKIASIDNMISINGAISVDLTGQVCAESIGKRQYSGTGGQLDFVRGASHSKSGYSFIALPSTVVTKKEGRKSRIVFSLEPGSVVTTPRTDVHWVATEYGCVKLKDLSITDRMRAMISIAHPDYRDELAFQVKQAGLWV